MRNLVTKHHTVTGPVPTERTVKRSFFYKNPSKIGKSQQFATAGLKVGMLPALQPPMLVAP
jgi:hypothetical protein